MSEETEGLCVQKISIWGVDFSSPIVCDDLNTSVYLLHWPLVQNSYSLCSEKLSETQSYYQKQSSTVWNIQNLPLTEIDNERRQLKSYILGYIHYLSLFYFFTGDSYSSGILSFKKCVYLCMTYILRSTQMLR